MSPEQAPPRPLRRDAERNRELIIEAAREAFAEEGLHVGLHEIARRAGVGVGTVYRRFPDKEDLVDAIFEDRVGDVLAMANAALAFDDAFEGLRHFFVSVMELQAGDRGLYDCVFSQEAAQERVARGREQIVPLVMQLVARAQQQGTLRPDVTGFDVGILRATLGHLMEATRDSSPDAWRRYLEVILDGLRTSRDGPSPLPGGAPSPEQFARALGDVPPR